MKNISVMVFLFALPLIGMAQEKCSPVKEVGYCWSGHHAAIAQMENGDQIYLGVIDEERTKLMISFALTSQATKEQVCYRILETKN